MPDTVRVSNESYTSGEATITSASKYEGIFKNVLTATNTFVRIDGASLNDFEQTFNATRYSIKRLQEIEGKPADLTEGKAIRSRIENILFDFQRFQMEELRLEYDEARRGGGIVFTIDRSQKRKELGEGATSVVYEAKAIGGIEGLRTQSTTDDLEPIAVKVAVSYKPYLGTTTPEQDETSLAENIEYLHNEAQNLHRLKQVQGEMYSEQPLHFPEAVEVVIDNAPALALELLPRENILLTQIGNGEINTQQLISCLIQHFSTLDIAHHAGFSVNDKKDRDFYYFPDEDRYVMTDWNITSPTSDIEINSGHDRSTVDLLMGINFFLSWGELPETVQLKLKSLQTRIESKNGKPTASDIVTQLKEIETD